MKITDITQDELKRELASKRESGKWTDVFARVKKDKVAVKIEGVTRGQVASIYRGAKEAGLTYRTNYKEGYIVIAPAGVEKLIETAT